MIGRWQSNCVGDYCGGAIYVAARHEGVEGDYVLAMYMDADPRDRSSGATSSASPRSRPGSQLYRSGSRFRGLGRAGRRAPDRPARGADRGARPERGRGRELQLQGAAGGSGAGLEEDAILTLATFHTTCMPHAPARAPVSASARHGPRPARRDPRRVGRSAARFVECDIAARASAVATVPGRPFLPYHHGRHDDWSALDTERAALVADG